LDFSKEIMPINKIMTIPILQKNFQKKEDFKQGKSQKDKQYNTKENLPLEHIQPKTNY
jgi:hypothetical protein